MMLIKVMRIIGPCFHTIHEAVENELFGWSFILDKGFIVLLYVVIHQRFHLKPLFIYNLGATSFYIIETN